MIHPHTRLHYINDEIGYGVFATQFIPKGTITYVKDILEPEVTPEQYAAHSPKMREQIEKYSYIDNNGIRIVSWDFGKYVNHCCHCNTISTGYGFEIAIADINPGEEITDEYGIFNLEKSMGLVCKFKDCRGKVCKKDFDNCFAQWDDKIKPALSKFHDVEQPLQPFLDEDTLKLVEKYLRDPNEYVSVYNLKLNSESSPTILQKSAASL